MSSFPGVELETEQLAVEAMSRLPRRLAPTIEHRSVVTGEDHQRVAGHARLVEGRHDLPHDPIQLVDKIAIGAHLASASKSLSRREGMVNVGCREVREERRVLLFLNPPDGFPGQCRADFRILVKRVGRLGTADLVGSKLFVERAGLCCRAIAQRIVFHQADDMMVFDIDKRRMAVDDRHAEIVIETKLERPRLERFVPIGRRLGTEAQVPLSDAGSRVARFLCHIRHGRAIW